MVQIGEMRLSDGTAVLVEVEGQQGSGIDRVGRGPGSGIVRDSAHTLQEALAHIRPAVEAVADSVRGLTSRPDSVSVEFGIKLSAEAGVVVAKAASEANFAVRLEWDARDPGQSGA
ncbi:CU044_2847 family protein [Streptomyces sp. NPDC018947]|uniref:CU044_2847 family protein n=1 Tax=Streptomyces sp. NPDC018947 TaxID=3365054 RepID=UPI0037A27635